MVDKSSTNKFSYSKSRMKIFSLRIKANYSMYDMHCNTQVNDYFHSGVIPINNGAHTKPLCLIKLYSCIHIIVGICVKQSLRLDFT